MKVCVLISGYFRNFETTYESFEKNILKKFEKIDVYLHVTKNENNEDKYYNNISTEDIEVIKRKLRPLYLIEEENKFFSEDTSTNNTINQWSKYFQLNKIKEKHEEIFGNYDIVIKYRPDIYFLSDFEFNLSENNIFIPIDSKIDKSKLINPNDSHICDVFAYGGSKLMSKYFEIFNNIDSLIKKYGSISETILYKYLKESKIKFKIVDIEYQILLSKCNLFAICGDSGSGKTTLGIKLKEYFKNSFILECDRYHKWERNHENWKTFTHLHPNANFLTKMENDIFNLKYGNNIYQVDYDHKNGLFTEKKLIESSETTIVCGLHPLYVQNQNLYNLKIFLDTEDLLKYEWKINRDVNERGYSLEKVLTQINKRKVDYRKFIKPQKNKSDIIIRLFKNNSKDVGLKIYIKKRFNIFNLLETFSKKNTNITLLQNDQFFIFHFDSYKPINLWKENEITKHNNFYDYIIFTITNLLD
jgi:uridine kinase